MFTFKSQGPAEPQARACSTTARAVAAAASNSPQPLSTWENAIDRSPAGENPLADVGLEVRPVLTKADLDAARAG